MSSENKLKQILNKDIARLRNTTNSKNLIVSFLARKNFRIVILYRILNFYYSKWFFPFLLPLYLYYRLMCNKYCVDLPIQTKIGAGLRINHAYCIIVNKKAIIGDNCQICHNVTIGSHNYETPTIGNNVSIYPGSVISGKVVIGDNVKIGANSVVIKDIADNLTVVSDPCKPLNKKNA